MLILVKRGLSRTDKTIIIKDDHFRVLSVAFLVGWMYRGLKQLRLLTVRLIRLFFADGRTCFLGRWLRRLGLKDC